MGDRWFDLGNFAVNNELDDDAGGAAARGLLRRAAGRPAAQPTLKLFRFMSDFREAMWGVVQTGVSELDFDFGEYAQQALRPPGGGAAATRASRAGSRRPAA